jgi:hypothetical protein
MKSIKQKILHNLSTIIYKRMFDKIVHSKKPMHFIKKKKPKITYYNKEIDRTTQSA